MKIRAAARTDVGRVRPGNEDAFGLAEASSLFVVCDGMGGHAGGEVASRVAVDALLARVAADDPPPGQALPALDILRENLRSAVRAANDAVFRRSIVEPALHGMGTTLVACRMAHDNALIAHVGDSRAYRLRQGTLALLTEDHSLVNEHVRAGRMTPQEAREFGFQNVITRALGIAPHVEVDIATDGMLPGDVYLLCTDGLSVLVPEEEIAAVLREGGELESVCERLIASANERGGRDNITVLLARAEADPPAPPTPSPAKRRGLRSLFGK